MNHKKTERGQTALEFTLIAPLLFGAVFLIAAIAMGWYAHGLASALALEGAAREAASPGAGFSLLEEANIPGELRMGFGSSVNSKGRTGKVFTVQGVFKIPLEPLGFDMEAGITSGALAPLWEFVP